MKKLITSSLIAIIALLPLSSCQKATYNDNPDLNTYTDLQPGKPYTFTLRNSKTMHMNYTTMTKDSIIGNRRDKRIAIAKKDLASSINVQKNRMITTASVIGAAGVAALIITSSKADK